MIVWCASVRILEKDLSADLPKLHPFEIEAEYLIVIF